MRPHQSLKSGNPIPHLPIFIGIILSLAGCDRPECRNGNALFEKYSPSADEYKDELIRQMAIRDSSSFKFWFDSIYENDTSRDILVTIQSDSLCAQIQLSVRSSKKGIEQLLLNNGLGYRGAELKGLKFRTEKDSLSTEFIFQEISKIVD